MTTATARRLPPDLPLGTLDVIHPSWRPAVAPPGEADLAAAAQDCRIAAIGDWLDACGRMGPRNVAALSLQALALWDELWAGEPPRDLPGDPLGRLATELRDEAAWWADSANAIEIETYLVALLRVMPGRLNGQGIAARRRLLAALWQSLDDADRRDFLTRADPRGRLTGGTPPAARPPAAGHAARRPGEAAA